MNQEEIILAIREVKKKQNLSYNEIEKRTGVDTNYIRAFYSTKKTTIGLKNILKILDALDLKLVVEDKHAEWGTDMARLRRMPKQLYLAERIESREIVKENGFYPRVDLFDNVDTALKFMPTPCDLYEISVSNLIRKKFDVIDHPYGLMYSYNDHIAPNNIRNMVTHR